jgi:hypothetical protein
MADRLRLIDAPLLLGLSFAGRVEEQLHLHPAAGRRQLPVPLLGDRRRSLPGPVDDAVAESAIG